MLVDIKKLKEDIKALEERIKVLEEEQEDLSPNFNNDDDPLYRWWLEKEALGG